MGEYRICCCLGFQSRLDERIPWAWAADPTTIDVSMYINRVSLCSHRQIMKIGGYFRQFWHDPRLDHQHHDSSEEDEDHDHSNGHDEHGKVLVRYRDMFDKRTDIWVPDTFLVGGEGHILGENAEGTVRSGRTFLRVMDDGLVQSSMNMDATVMCPFSKDDEEVVCEATFESYGFNAKDVVYKWKDEEKNFLVDDQNVLKMLKNKGWELSNTEFSRPTSTVGKNEYTGVEVSLTFKKINP